MAYGLIVGLLLAALTTYAALFAPPVDKFQYPALLCVMLFGYGTMAFFAYMIRQCNSYLEVTDDHIMEHRPNKPSLVLAWDDITEIKNNLTMERLVLRSSKSNVAIAVEYQIEGFDELRQIIRAKTQKD
jgi:FtsH-binding integral membrane protein